MYESGLRSLVELTSVSIELFRKMAEVSLLPDVSKIAGLTVQGVECLKCISKTAGLTVQGVECLTVEMYNFRCRR